MGDALFRIQGSGKRMDSSIPILSAEYLLPNG
jgi:hypothetical protein